MSDGPTMRTVAIDMDEAAFQSETAEEDCLRHRREFQENLLFFMESPKTSWGAGEAAQPLRLLIAAMGDGECL